MSNGTCWSFKFQSFTRNSNLQALMRNVFVKRYQNLKIIFPEHSCNLSVWPWNFCTTKFKASALKMISFCVARKNLKLKFRRKHFFKLSSFLTQLLLNWKTHIQRWKCFSAFLKYYLFNYNVEWRQTSYFLIDEFPPFTSKVESLSLFNRVKRFKSLYEVEGILMASISSQQHMKLL